jgi:hypothetical protein
MNIDNAPANLRISLEMPRGGDTGRRGAEHRNFLQLWFTHQNVRYRLGEPLYHIQEARFFGVSINGKEGKGNCR